MSFFLLTIETTQLPAELNEKGQFIVPPRLWMSIKHKMSLPAPKVLSDSQGIVLYLIALRYYIIIVLYNIYIIIYYIILH